MSKIFPLFTWNINYKINISNNAYIFKWYKTIELYNNETTYSAKKKFWLVTNFKYYS